MSHDHPHPHPHGHGHGHAHPHQPQGMMEPPPGAVVGVPDELITLRALAVDSNNVVSAPNGDVPQTDLANINNLVKALVAQTQNPGPLPPGVPPQFKMTEYIPPPPQPIPNIRSNHIAKAKEDGNTAFKAKKFDDAIKLYSISAVLSASRPVYDSAQYSRDELSIALCNRSAAYAAAGQYIEALVDADAVIKLKRPWTKGHFRKGKALQGMGELDDAKEAFLLGLEFEPANEDLGAALDEVERAVQARKSSTA